MTVFIIDYPTHNSLVADLHIMAWQGDSMLKRRTLLFFALSLPVTCLSQSDTRVPKTVEITGKVRKPGKYELRDNLRIFDALGSAGGFLDFANTRKIVIIRGTERYNFNFRDFIQGKRLEENILLEGGDVIVVP